MNAFEKFVTWLQGTMTQPTLYGWFHLMFFALLVVITVVVCIRLKNATDKQVKIVVLIYAIICLILEVYKQIIFSHSGNGEWSYQWYAFPFQLCSTPMYIALLAGLIKKGKVQQSLYSYLATFGLLGGLLVMLYPGDVFISTIGINIQTMIHHGGQVFIGIFLIATKRVKIDFKTPLRALPTFLSLLAIALTLNLTVGPAVNGTFNMFFISPHYPCTLPVFNIIYDKVPYVVFLLIYIVGFTIGAYLVTLFVQAIQQIYHKCRRKKALKK